jgi:DNA-binding response OmpR family regulator
MRILIAEDDATSRLVLAATLRRWGHEVVETCDGLDAWQALQAPDAPSLAVLDWMMPGLDGLELSRRARSQPETSGAYLILLTALGQKENVARGLEAGADDYVTKPFDAGELRARIEVGRRILELQSALALKVADLERALAEIQTLHGMIPICMHCHRIRTESAEWQKMEKYIESRSKAQFSHSICPECLEKLYPDDTGSA